MSDKTVFTVLVPTRERADTLHYALRTLTQQRYEALTIIVSDNASLDHTQEVVRRIGDSRVRYVNTGRRLSMSHNFEFALSQVQEGWVGFIGDDDGLLPGALERLNAVIAETGCSAITSGWCYYRWPRAGWELDAPTMPRMLVPLGRGHQVRDSRRWLKRLLDGDAQYPELPWLYTGGFASMNLVRKAMDDRGRFFRSRIPDVYSSIALAAVSETYVAMRAPVAISGVSSHSTGHSQMFGGRRSPGEMFEQEDNLPIHPKLDCGFPTTSMTLFVYESYLQAQPLHGDTLQIDMAEQLARALVRQAPEGRIALEQYVRSAAEQNAIDFDTVRARVSKRGLLRSLADYRRALALVLSRRSIMDAYGASDVVEASWTANAVYQERMQGRFWRAKEIAQRLRSRVGARAGARVK